MRRTNAAIHTVVMATTDPLMAFFEVAWAKKVEDPKRYINATCLLSNLGFTHRDMAYCVKGNGELSATILGREERFSLTKEFPEKAFLWGWVVVHDVGYFVEIHGDKDRQTFPDIFD